jgi:hypothetical protein
MLETIYSFVVLAGTGTFTFSDGSKYTGDWFDDKMHGDGKLSLPSGDVRVIPCPV